LITVAVTIVNNARGASATRRPGLDLNLARAAAAAADEDDEDDDKMADDDGCDASARYGADGKSTPPIARHRRGEGGYSCDDIEPSAGRTGP